MKYTNIKVRYYLPPSTSHSKVWISEDFKKKHSLDKDYQTLSNSKLLQEYEESGIVQHPIAKELAARLRKQQEGSEDSSPDI